MSTTKFVVRDVAGNVQHGVVGEGHAAAVSVAPGQAISLNLRPDQILSYERDGQDLKVVLADGSVIVVAGVFDAGGDQQADVYISADGALQRVSLYADGEHGVVPNYTEAAAFGKWSPEDDLYFVRGTDAAYADAQVLAPAEDGEVGMLATALLGGFGGGGVSALGVGGAALAGAALLGGGGKAAPTVDLALTSGTKSAGVLVNSADYADGVTLGGTGSKGGVVTVTVRGVSKQATVDGNGNWSVTYAPSELPGGTYETGVSVSIKGANGATKTVTDVLDVDTVTTVSVASSTIETDGVVSGAEHSDGVVLAGSAEAGASVVVTMAGFSRTVQADANGKWTANFTQAEVPSGEVASVPVTAVATDANGNTATAQGAFRVDTLVNDLKITPDFTGGDAKVNLAEVVGGLDLAGTVEAGSTVTVTFNGNTYNATVTGTSWSVTIPEGDIPAMQGTAHVVVNATDAVGNVANVSQSFTMDTTAPNTPDTQGMLDVGSISGVQLGPVDGALEVHQIDVQGQGAGTVSQVSVTDTGSIYTFANHVPDGHDLIVTAKETGSGNSSSTLFVTNDAGAQAVNVNTAAMSNFEIKKIDLDLADNSSLSLTAQQVKDLAKSTDTLYIDGGSDDTVTLTGARRDTSKDKTENGRSYDAYDFGGDVLVYVDDSAQVVT